MPTTPGVSAPIFTGPDLFNPPPPRGWATLTPSVAIIGEYNDNLDSSTKGNEIEDYILSIVPGFTLSLQRPEYQLLAGYNFSADLYANENSRSGLAKRQQLFGDLFYEVSPRVTFTLSERFIADRDSSIVSVGGVSAGGGEESYRNTITPGLQWQMTQLSTLRLSGAYSILRFSGDNPDDQDTDTYRVGIGVDYKFTPRLTGAADFGVAYFDPEEDSRVWTYTPRVGFEYQFTPTLRGFIHGGPSLVVRVDDSDQRIVPAGGAGLERVFRFGSFKAAYDRSVTAETVGIVDRQTVFASLRFATLQRGLLFDVTPRYTHADRDVQGVDRKIDSFTVNLRATYQFARSVSLIAAYSFFGQREERVGDIDQNRVFLGLQYAYPINFD